jgi:glyoxylase-like metal-dependent hydrolase (beta-lactamase superfamily II)
MEAAATPRWTIHAVDTGTSTIDGSMLTYTANAGTPTRIPRVIWVVRGPTTVVVDTSVEPGGRASEFIGEELVRTPDQEPANALHLAGLDPKDVEFVVLTHLHWDHAGNCDLFPDASVLVQEAELRYAIAPGRFFRKAFLAPTSGWGTPPYLVANLQTVAGAHELAPGLRLVQAPGHTPGSQALVVDTEHGRFAIAGDAICTYDSIDRDLPPGYHVDVDASMDSLDGLRAAADHLLPSHDYGVFTDGPVTEIGPAHGAGRLRAG